MIPFNKPYMVGREIDYIMDAVNRGKLSGNGYYTQLCQKWFELKYGFKKCLLTTSCTDALEMCAILARIQHGDEVIMPSFTFVSTAIAFERCGAKIRFVDSNSENPNIDVSKIEEIITSKTKAIVVVHYAGIACDMDAIMSIASKYNLIVIEDAAQAIDNKYLGLKRENSLVKDKYLGSIGHLSAFSFHETKNIISGEGGMIVINDNKFINRAEVIWEKGTNRAEFFRGEVNKYGWKDIGSSFLPSELIASFLYAQLENLEIIQEKRKLIWHRYFYNLVLHQKRKHYIIPDISTFSENNAHMFFLVFESMELRSRIINALKEREIQAVFHYLSLHKSEYFEKKYSGPDLTNCDRFSDTLLRLPLFFELQLEEVDLICQIIIDA